VEKTKNKYHSISIVLPPFYLSKYFFIKSLRKSLRMTFSKKLLFHTLLLFKKNRQERNRLAGSVFIFGMPDIIFSI